MNLGSLQQDNIDKFGEYECSFYEGKWYTNVDLERNANRLGHALRSLGVISGDRVAIQMLNCPTVIWSFSAIYKLGAIVVPVNPLLSLEQSTHIFQDCGAKVVITSPEFASFVLEAQKQVASLKYIIMIEQDNIPGTLFYDRIIADQSDGLEVAETDNNDVAALIYTAGTTARSKGVMHTHFSLYMNAMGCIDFNSRYLSTTANLLTVQRDIRSQKVVQTRRRITGYDTGLDLLVLPLSHTYGISVVLNGLLIGQRNVILKRFTPEAVLKCINDFKINRFAGVPTMYTMLLNYPGFDKYDLSSLQYCSCGAAPLLRDTGILWKQKTGIDIYEGWGMTETCATTCCNRPDRPPKYGSIGICIQKTCAVKIFSDVDRELPQGKAGEMVVKGPTVMKGYWNMPQETAEALRNGWLHTGDIAYMDEEGHFYITGRKKDIIIRGGENISPLEVEEVLLQIPEVADAGVIGIYDETYGEEIKAFCVPQPGRVISAEEIIACCRQKLPCFKVPKTVTLVDSLPKNQLGKLLRGKLQQMK